MSKALPLTLLAFALQGCLMNSVTKVNPEGSKVQLVNETEKPSECKFLGKINGSSHADDEKVAKTGAENEMRNKTAALKGNFAVVETTRGGRIGTTSQRDVVINGKAYFCKTLDESIAEEEKTQKAIQEKEDREAQEKADREAKLEEAKANAEEARLKREQLDKEADEKEAAAKKDKKKGKSGD
jgi:hypothetical protein